MEKTSLKKNSIKAFLCLITVLLLGTVLTACNNDTGNTVEFAHAVTFDYNDGYLVGKNNMKENQTLGVDDNALVGIRPGYNDKFSEGKFENYYVAGWYLPKTDEEGNLVKQDAAGNIFIEKTDRYGAVKRYEYDLELGTEGKEIVSDEDINDEKYVDDTRVILDKEWIFEENRVTEDLTLYADLKLMAKLRGIDIATGEEIRTWQRAPKTKFNKPEDGIDAPTKSGYTFLRKYYNDAEKKEECEWPYVFGEEDEVVYIEMKEGSWGVVLTAAELISQMRAGSRNIHLAADIDLAEYGSTARPLWTIKDYNMEFDGNGHVIKNITRNFVAAQNSKTNHAGIFGTLGKNAYIHDVTFENVTVTHDVVDPEHTAINLYVGLLAWKADEGARLENVTIVNSSLSYHDYNGGVRGSNWITQDSTRESDVVNCSHDVPVTTIPSNTESGSEE
ncbi:MAG: hypothetical protein K2G31_04145 [Clostridia bacterium]|nr:hypothetical protein [Clostridia bacterium]